MFRLSLVDGQELQCRHQPMLYIVAVNSIVVHGRTNSTVDVSANLACYVECVIVAVELELDQAA